MNVLHTECGLNWGGQEYRTLIEAGWLNANGHRAWIACDPRSELFRRGREQFAPVTAVSMRHNADIPGLQMIWKLCRRQRVDVIHTHGPKDSWMCLPLHLAGYPVVRSRHITIPIKPGIAHSFIYRHGCRRVVATAQVIRDTLVNVNKLNSARVDVVGEGVNLDEYHPGVDGLPFRNEFGIAPDALLVGIVAMMRGDKGHHFFLDAALETLKTHPHARFVLVGEGIGGRRVERECRDRIETAGEQKRIIMTGYRWDIPRVMAALDMVVIASIAVEAQSRIVPQAFASRRAVIATRVGGIPELVRDGDNGLLVPPGDGGAIADATRRLMDDPNLRRRLAEGGYETACARLSLTRMMEETLAVYRKAIASG
ncbi:MAG: glycosyltransferase family 4 protein [Verrucomicrobia bacterium]|nr:glycosyltransferase family 4 protein [Verrucomicrobiota bacterium]